MFSAFIDTPRAVDCGREITELALMNAGVPEFFVPACVFRRGLLAWLILNNPPAPEPARTESRVYFWTP